MKIIAPTAFAAAAAAAFALAAHTMSAPAQAAGTSDLVNQCVAALDENGAAKADDYRARFVSSKGASSKTITLKLTPVAGGEPVTAECVIKRGEVQGAAIKA